ncbi:LANO_0D03994g1_1 [Lachancea nothofagi CBS 11611]|uniref:LANO_0D03994g1_1 n=1 Tax=Lachancea nothofagi CBS 11611 TaxID=1266666 RepID=A0A1G4JFY0_9SACH|nr:LANO_0D03994g1_1 [Lachancea nothofagi CBS 11611]
MSQLGLRRVVALWFVAVYILVGIPLWYKLTTIYRAPLPSTYIRSIQENMHSDVHVVVPVYVRSETYKFPDIHDAIQAQVNALILSKATAVNWSLQVLQPEQGQVLDPESDHVLTLVLDDFTGYSVAYDSKETFVFFDNEAVVSNDVPFFAAQTLVEHTFATEWNHISRGEDENDGLREPNSEMAISYAPAVHLSISLLTGDGRPVAWDIDSTLEQYFTPLRRFLSPLVNFTVDTSIVQFNDLNLESLHQSQNPSWQDLAHTIDLSELSSMNYYLEKNALNLAIVFPSPEVGQLAFINATKERPWQSFMVPQWGALVVNKEALPDNSRLTKDYLAPVIYSFARELFQFLGLTSETADLTTPYTTIDSFKRLTTLKSLEQGVETLWSLVKLTEQFPQMSVPKQVLDDVVRALDLRLQIIELLNDPNQGGDVTWNKALWLSNAFVEVCEKAFFHKEMVQQNFFPQEHKVAVYLPLLGPLSVITFTGLINALREKKESTDPDKGQESEEKREKEAAESKVT